VSRLDGRGARRNASSAADIRGGVTFLAGGALLYSQPAGIPLVVSLHPTAARKRKEAHA